MENLQIDVAESFEQWKAREIMQQKEVSTFLSKF